MFVVDVLLLNFEIAIEQQTSFVNIQSAQYIIPFHNNYELVISL